MVQNAFNAIPSPVGFLLSDVPRFFNKSTIRRNEYEKLFELMNPNNERMGTPSPFQKYSATRWLVRGKCLYNLLVNWLEQKTKDES